MAKENITPPGSPLSRKNKVLEPVDVQPLAAIDNLSGRQLVQAKAAALKSEVVYLPPLLSLLPSQAVQPPAEAFDFDRPTVGFTTSRLPSIDLTSWHLHNGLYNFKPTSRSYARVPYDAAFNWAEIELPLEVERDWYAVAFRSIRRPGSRSVDLYQADRDAHEEAVAAGGLLCYWYGSPDEEGHNLATCIWQNRQAAVEANSGPKHIIAINLARDLYSQFKLERYIVRKIKGRPGLVIEDYRSGSVGF